MREARAAGMDVFLSSTLDGPWGIAAALQLAAAEELTLACGLATLAAVRLPPRPRAPAAARRNALRARGPRARREHRGRDLAAVTLATLP